MNVAGRSERDKMTAGKAYQPSDPELSTLRKAANQLVQDYNAITTRDQKPRAAILKKLLGTWNGAVINPPIEVVYGKNIHFEEACFVSAGCVIEDVCEVRIGSFTQISPNVRIRTSVRDHASTTDSDMGRPVTIGRNVWVGAGAVINPGVTLGDDAIVGAGAVVVDDVAEGQTVVGNPARAVA